MLDGTGDAQRNIDLGMHRLTGLADLMVSADPTGIDAGAGRTHDTAQDLCQLLGQLDAALDVLGDTTADGHDKVGTDQVNQLLGGLHGLGHGGLDVGSCQLHLGMHQLSGLLALTALHNAGTHGCHSGTETGADDGGHQVTAESGTGHLQVAGHVVILTGDLHGAQLLDTLGGQSGSFLQESLVVGHIDVQMGAVSAQTRVQTGGAAGSQVTADVGCTKQQHLRLELLNGIHDHLGVTVGGVVLQQGGVVHVHLVGAVLAQLGSDTVNVVTQQDAAQLNTQLIGQLAALGDQFESGGHHHALALLAEHPYVLEGADISTIKRHSFFLLSLR